MSRPCLWGVLLHLACLWVPRLVKIRIVLFMYLVIPAILKKFSFSWALFSYLTNVNDKNCTSSLFLVLFDLLMTNVFDVFIWCPVIRCCFLFIFLLPCLSLDFGWGTFSMELSFELPTRYPLYFEPGISAGAHLYLPFLWSYPSSYPLLNPSISSLVLKVSSSLDKPTEHSE